MLNLEVKKECKMDLPGRNVDFGALFSPLLQRKIPTRLLHERSNSAAKGSIAHHFFNSIAREQTDFGADAGGGWNSFVDAGLLDDLPKRSPRVQQRHDS